MSTSSSKETHMLMYTNEGKWSDSVESIFTQKIAKLTKSDSLFNLCSKFSPSLTFSELELREIHFKNFKEKTPKWELVHDKSRFPRIIHTRSLLLDELEILRINMSMHEKTVTLRQSQIMRDVHMKAKKKKMKKYMKLVKKPFRSWCKCMPPKMKDLLTEIEGSETAKTDTVIWKFLKRGPSFRKDYINARKLLLEIQALQLPGFGFLTYSRFQSTQPVKITCPNCMFFVTTRVKKVSSIRTKIVSLVLAIVGLCIVPHVFYAFKDTVHLCPLCKIYLGFCPALSVRLKRQLIKSLEFSKEKCERQDEEEVIDEETEMVSASSTSAKNLFVESKLRLSDRVQVNVNNIAGIARQIQRGSKANENLMTAAKNFALQEAAIDNSETNLKKLKLLTTHINNQLDSLQNSASKMEVVLEQVRSMQR